MATSSSGPLGAGSLVAQAAMLIAALAHGAGDGATAAQARRIGTRAGLLSLLNDAAFTAATQQLLAAASGQGDRYWLEIALGDAAGTPLVICETACDLALLAADLAHTCDGTRRADYIAIAQLSATAASSAALLVRTNLVVSDDDWGLSEASTAVAEAARAAQRNREEPRQERREWIWAPSDAALFGFCLQPPENAPPSAPGRTVAAL